MKKIILAALNARYSHTNLAIRYLRNSIKDLDYNVLLMEFTINNHVSDIVQSLVIERPYAVAFSVYIWNAEIIGEIIARLRAELPECRIILGGPEVSYSHDQWLKAHEEIDYIISGPGESAFRKLALQGMNAAGPLLSASNPHFNEIPFAYVESDFKGMKNRTIYYESSRGCSFRCSYCLSSRSDHALEFRDNAKVKDELDFILKYSPSYLKFVDRTFNVSRERSRDLWACIIDRYGVGGTFFHFEINPTLLEDEDFRLLSSCPQGLFQFELGIQSTNERSLKAVNRPGAFDAIKERVERLIALKNIHTHADLIAGLPYEDEGSLRKSFNDIYSLGADHFQPGLLKILHGTEMKEIADEKGYAYNTRPPYQTISTPWLLPETVSTYESIAFLVERLYNSQNFPLTLKSLSELFSSPYDCYHDMHVFYQEQSRSPLDRGRESGASFLFDYINAGDRRGRVFLIDCLRWDWCAASKNRHYARFLKSETTRGAAKRFMGMVHFFMREPGPAWPPLTADEVKRAIVFSPESDVFRERHLHGHDLAVFVPGRPGPLLY
ncbi:MAG TPA: DUF4080 domain-containing protein [Spirochaetota bacterium]|nr:DUF4080 domain-containing protein [Spirochaetota bacterium]HPI87882.1 DUF4080 domain-containing protein [Spirochaetota bacterium]HPR47386.1 DUF4080 domain-containing protein [Spirochaetota bacterium]